MVCPADPESPIAELPCLWCLQQLATSVARNLAGVRKDLRLLFEQQQVDHLTIEKLRTAKKRLRARLTLAEARLEQLEAGTPSGE